MRSVSVLIVGDEILRGEIADANGPLLIARLGAEGVRIQRQVCVPDDASEIAAELTRLRAISEAVVISGGVGPTHDDVTRPAVARALGVGLEVQDEALARIRDFYGDAATEAELAMAHMPQGARVLHGRRTGTFGFEVGHVYVLPGVPALFEDLLEGIASEFRGAQLHCEVLQSERREGELAAVLLALERDHEGVGVGSYPVLRRGSWHVRIVLRGEDPARVAAAAEALRPLL